VAPTDQLAFEGEHHLVKVYFDGEVEADLDSKVSGAFPFWDPSKAYFSTPGPGSFFFTGPNGDEFVLVYFGLGCMAEKLEYILSSVHIGWGALEVERSVIREGLVLDVASFGEG
jgi:hypothetical protein